MDIAKFGEQVAEELSGTLDAYVKDLDALTDDQFSGAPGGGSARTPADFTCEVVQVNRYIAKRLRGEEASLSGGPGGEWTVAPAEFRDKAFATSELQAATHEILDAFKALPSPDQMVKTMRGETQAYDMVLFAAKHMTYHDGQLNLVQQLAGDMKVHWF